jgi:uncharacterized protein YwgA
VAEHDRLFSCMERLGLEIDMTTFTERKKVQKLVYLLKEFGINFSFDYNWYLHGPYSPGLTKTVFDVLERGHQVQKKDLSEKENRALEKLRKFLGPSIESSDELELLVSLHYLRDRAKEYDESKEAVMSILKEKKPYFSMKQIEFAWQKLDMIA